MKIESLEITNFKVFRNVKLQGIPSFAVFLGRNGVGKSTFFDVFGFLHDCLIGNVKAAILKRGGFNEVRAREAEGDIGFKIQFRPGEEEPLITYEISIGQDEAFRIIVKSEILRMRRGQHGAPWKILDFSRGEGVAAEGVLNTYQDVQLAKRTKQSLESPDILAIKGLGQFKNFIAVNQFRKLIEDWYVADFRIDAARKRQEANYSEQLSRTGDNLAAVAKYMYETYPEKFNVILQKMKERVPGIQSVEPKTTEDGYIILRFQDGQFENPFSAKFVSDGTIKMFTYLVLLNAPEQHALLCIEEPENQLYPELLAELAEEFRQYSRKGQVFVSTHSPDFLNAVEVDEIFILVKKEGFTTIQRASDDEQITNLCLAGDKPGMLWKQGLLGGDFR